MMGKRNKLNSEYRFNIKSGFLRFFAAIGAAFATVLFALVLLPFAIVKFTLYSILVTGVEVLKLLETNLRE